MNKEVYVIFGVAIFDFRFKFNISMLANLPDNVCKRRIGEFSL